MFINQIGRFLQQWRRYNRSLHELSQLGDHELADIGISRSDIPRIAWDSSVREASKGTRASGRQSRSGAHAPGLEHGLSGRAG
jgi:uncharacterized protein YjiS (DUF1127 family)